MSETSHSRGEFGALALHDGVDARRHPCFRFFRIRAHDASPVLEGVYMWLSAIVMPRAPVRGIGPDAACAAEPPSLALHLGRARQELASTEKLLGG